MKGWQRGIGMVGIALALAVSGAAWGGAATETKVALDGREARTSECTTGDLVADAARSAVQAEVALVQAAQFRPAVIPVGGVTCEELEAALLYPDEQVVRVDLPGSKLLAALERSLSALPQPSTGFLQVSGLTVTFRSDAPPGGRIVTVKIGEADLSPGKTYRVALPATLAKGALGYFRIFNGLEPKATGPSLSAAACTYARSLRVVNIRPGQRLRDLSRPVNE
jgi:2',3'-cyclic-nucleotide 2'-phosphodiesterase (5'-nucleotidase family)